MALITSVRDSVSRGVVRHWNADGMIADLSLDAEHRARHMAIDTRGSGTARCMMAMLRYVLANVGMALRADGIRAGLQRDVFLNLRIVHVGMAVYAGRSALEETFALP